MLCVLDTAIISLCIEISHLLTFFHNKAFEFLLPIAFLGIVVALKNTAGIEDDDFYAEVRSSGFYESMASKFIVAWIVLFYDCIDCDSLTLCAYIRLCCSSHDAKLAGKSPPRPHPCPVKKIYLSSN